MESTTAELSESSSKHEAAFASEKARSKSFKTTVRELTSKFESKVKESERLRRQYQEAKEKLNALKRRRRKLDKNEAERKQLYKMLDCQVRHVNVTRVTRNTRRQMPM